jgi:hypothetical protein
MSAIGWRTLHGASNRVLADRLRDSKTVALGDMMGDRGGRQASLWQPIADVPCPLFRTRSDRLLFLATAVGELEPYDLYPLPRFGVACGSAACAQRRGTSRPVRRT